MAKTIKFCKEGIDDFGTPAYMKFKEPLYITIKTKDDKYIHGYVEYNTPCGELFEYLVTAYLGCKQISIGAL